MSLRQMAIAFDQLANATLGGYADETISARAWRKREDRGWKHFRVVIDRLFFWQPDHCMNSFNSELNRKQLPGTYGTDQKEQQP